MAETLRFEKFFIEPQNTQVNQQASRISGPPRDTPTIVSSHPPKNMDTGTTFLIIAFLIGFSLITIFLDRFMHNYERPDFALGVTISALALCGAVLLIGYHSNPESKATQMIFTALLAIALAGKLLIDKNNIDDQENGRMSRRGTWWDCWQNNYRCNIIDKWDTWAKIAILGWVMVIIAQSKDPATSFETNSNPSPNKAIAEKSAAISIAHRAVQKAHRATKKAKHYQRSNLRNSKRLAPASTAPKAI